jgi:hypothetical protein
MGQPIGDPVTASDLIREYERNEVAANTRFRGRWVEITGLVNDIGTDFLGTPYVTFTDGGVWGVQALFTRGSDEPLVSGFSKGQRLTITCRADGKLVNVLVRECRLP